MTLIALAGNPNSGKTTLFNRLTGLRQKVGNYPGVTVERRAGSTRIGDQDLTLIDLPGAYSLVARSQDEAIAFDALTGSRFETAPRAIISVVDATNLERNLYLTASILEFGVPTLVAVNMMDAAQKTSRVPDLEALSRHLGVPVVGISAKRNEGIEVLRRELERLLDETPRPVGRQWRLDDDGEAAIAAATHELRKRTTLDPLAADGAAVWALTSWAVSASSDEAESDPFEGREDLREAAAAGERALEGSPREFAAGIIEARYAVARTAAAHAYPKTGVLGANLTDRLDRVLLHPIFGTMVFVVVMAVVFQSVFAWAEPVMGAIEWGVGSLQSLALAYLPEGALRDLLVQGVIGGVGNIIVFVPQIAILFSFIAVLEDSGYLARAAFISDRLMARVGLHGRAFVPLLSGFACAVPAIMATRAIESRRDRIVTILVAPLVSCSARLPVYTLLIAALFAADQKIAGVFTVGGLMMLGMYGLSLVFTVGAAFVMKRTILASPTPPLVLELPPYRRPEVGSVLRRAYERCALFVRDAGTVILACSIVLWALLYFPRNAPVSLDRTQEAAAVEAAYRTAITDERGVEHVARMTEARDRALAQLDAQIEAERIQNSYAGKIGRAIEPIIEPLGYDWKIGVGLLASFAAREVFVSTLGLIYGVGEDADEGSVSLRQKLQAELHPDTNQPVYTPLVGLSLMVFFALALQCMSTVAAIRRETNSWQWPAFALAYTGILAWISAFVVYQGGILLGFT